MKFDTREQETRQLRQWSEQTASGQGLLTLMVGRRRVGKTALLNQTFQSQERPSLYLFISRKQESLLCDEFATQIRENLHIPIFGTPSKLASVMEILLQYSTSHPLTLIIDEFQDIQRVNPAFFSELQNLWDKYKSHCRMHLICGGSLYSIMTRLFQNSREPLFGRADNRIHLQPLRPAYIAELLADKQTFSNEAFLQWFMLSGGVPKYLEMLHHASKGDNIWDALISENSLLIEEGQYRLAEEFGPENSRYFSILSAIASGRTSRPEIESLLEKSIGPQLERLENEFDIIQRHQPVLAKPGSRLVRYRIADAFLAFWFRFIYSNRSAIEIRNFAFVRKLVERDYPTWSGFWLEELIRQLLADSGQFNILGSYWERGNKNEIDIVAISDLDKTVLIGEVKRKSANIRINKLKEKAHRLSLQLKGYKIAYRGFSLENIPELIDKGNTTSEDG